VDGTNQVNLTNATSNDTQPAWSPDGAKIAFTTKRGASNDVFVMNADGSSQTNLTHFRGSDTGPTWSPDGLKIAFTANRDGNNEFPIFSRDSGTRVIFTTNRDGNNELYIMNELDGSYQTNLTHNTSSDSAATWQSLVAGPANGSPIEHVVIIFQENHSFDNVL